MRNDDQQRGNILISVLLILLVMNLLGLGLVNSAVKDTSISAYKVTDSTVFYITESCKEDMIAYLSALTAAPTTDYTISESDLSHMYIGGETSAELQKLSGYSYSCTLTSITTKVVSASDSGIGKSLGGGGSYSAAADLSPKYYYQITAVGAGPRNSSKTIYTIVSVQF